MDAADPPLGVHISYGQQYRCCGKAGCSRCAPGRPGHGPYWYASWWEGGRRRSHYLGKQLPDGAGPVVGDARAAPVSAAAAAEPLRVRTLGGFVVWRGAAPLPAEAWSSRRATALFKCLLSTPGHRLQREQAIELLWPEAEPEAGTANLRTTIHLLRQILDGRRGAASHLRTQGELLVLAVAADGEQADDWLDATAFARAAQAALAGQDLAACRAALALYGGDFLPDDPYATWAEQPRASLRGRYLDLLLHQAGLSAARGELEEAEGCLRRVLAAEPGHEGAAATLMGLLAESGRRGEALQVYQHLAAVLEEELDVAPAAEIAALRARLLAQEATPVAAHLPPRQDQPARQTNLPLALTSFVGRRWEVPAVTETLAGARLVTLTGPGGCGKTRLALQAAERLVEAYPDGVWLVELAALADSALVPRAIAGALGLLEQPDRLILDTLRDFLRTRYLLLILDNCEHLLASCANLVASLLQSCPRLRILATSRERLEVPGEQTYRVPSLAVPDPDQLPPPERLATNEAVQLFLERAHSRRPELALTTGNACAVAQICVRLDGLPLAIELAAARVSALPVEAIAARLDDRFRLLTGGPRTALPRQQTLRATLDWSIALLGEAERVVLRRLAVFAGGCTPEAAEAVCADPAPPLPLHQQGMVVARDGVVDLLAGLVQKSLVLLEDRGAETRYRLLETVREYAREQLAGAGEMAPMRDRQLDWCLALGEQATPHILGSGQVVWLDRLEAEHDNLRAALQWSIEQPSRSVAGLQLAGAIWRLWAFRGYPHEGRHWLDETLRQSASVPANLRARALNGAAWLARVQGDYARAKALGEECLATWRVIGDAVGIARILITLGWEEHDSARAQAMGEESLALARGAGNAAALSLTLHFLGNLAVGQGDLARAETYLEESAAVARGLGDRMSLSEALQGLGQVAARRGAYARADALLRECLSLKRELGFQMSVAWTLVGFAEVAYCQGNTGRAIDALEESLRLCRDLGSKEHLAQGLNLYARIAWQRGDHTHATSLLEEGMSVARELGDRHLLADALTGLGHVALGRGDPARAITLQRESLPIRPDKHCAIGSLDGLAMALAAGGEMAQAAWLLGATDAAREGFGTPLSPPDRAVYDRSVAAIRGALGEEAWAAAWAAGRATPLEAAIDRALEAGRAP